MRIPFVVYVEIESLFEKICTWHNNPQIFYTTKISKHKACSYSLSTHYSLDCSKNKHDFFKDEDSMEKFSADLRKHASDIINFKKKVMLPLTKKEEKKYKKQGKPYMDINTVLRRWQKMILRRTSSS